MTGGRSAGAAGPEIVVVDDAAALADEGAARIRRAARAALDARGRFRIALAGGSTPKGVYRRLANRSDRDLAERDLAKRDPGGGVDWRLTDVFFGDERCVPPDHPDSNYGMARAALLDAAGVPDANVYRLRGEDPPEAAAAAYARALARPLDLALLGLGADGHTASLFPHTAALGETERACVAVVVPQLGVTRLTLTYPVFLEAREILFLVSGADKARALREVTAGAPHPADLPAQAIVRRPAGAVTIVCDRAAAASADAVRKEPPP